MISPKEPAEKRPPKDSVTLLPCFYFVELPIVASSMVSLYFLELTDVLQPALAGFQCHDRGLSMPYVHGAEELIPLLMLLSLAFAAPAASIMLGEGLLYCLQSQLKLRPQSEVSINAGGCNFNSFLRRTMRFVGVQVFGLLATALVTDVMQLATGYQTPFFLTVCQPNYSSPGVSCDRNSYITRDICSGRDQPAILAARKSFPSQHAALSAFAAVYISMYFNSTLSDSTRLLKPVLVFGFCMAAALVGLTQISQHHSHPVDVYAGFLIGAAIAAYLALYSVGNFKSCAEPPPHSPSKAAIGALGQRSPNRFYHKAGGGASSEELGAGPAGAGPRRGAGPRSRQVRQEKVSSADVELLAPRSTMGRETMVTFSNTLPRANCLGLAPPPDPARRPLTFPAPPLAALAPEWQRRSLELWGLGGAEPELKGERDSDRAHPQEAGPRSATPTPTPLYSAMATVTTHPRVPTPRPVAPPLVHIPEEMAPPPVAPPPGAPPPASPHSARWPSASEQGGAQVGGSPVGGAQVGGAPVGGAPVGGAPGPLRPPAQPRVAQVIAMSSLSARSSDTLSSSCASSSSGSESACSHAPPRGSTPCGHAPSRGPAGILTIDAHAPHHPVVRPPSSANGHAPWPAALRPAQSLSPAASVCGPAHEPPGPAPVHAGLGERALSLERARLTAATGLQRAGSLPHSPANQL